MDGRTTGTARAIRNGGTRRFVWGAGALFAVGTLLRFLWLAGRDLWYDECCTYIHLQSVGAGWSQTIGAGWSGGPSDGRGWGAFFIENATLLYYALLGVWTSMFGQGEAAYRSLSALAAAATLPVVAWTAWRLGGRRLMLICTAIAAFHPLHVYYAHEARAYALWVLMLSLAVLFLVEAGRRGGWRWWAFGAALAAALWTHHLTLFFIPATLAGVWLSDRRAAALGRWLLAVGGALVAFGPALIAIAGQSSSTARIAWIAARFDSVLSVPGSLWAMLPAGEYPSHLRGLATAVGVDGQAGWAYAATVANILCVCVLAWLVVTWVLAAWASHRMRIAGTRGGAGGPREPREPRERPERRQEGLTARCLDGQPGRCGDDPSDRGQDGLFRPCAVWFAICLTVGPLALLWLYSVVVRPAYMVGRYDMMAWPGCVLLWGLIVDRGADRAPVLGTRRWHPFRAAGVCVILMLCGAVPIARFLTAPHVDTPHKLRARRLAALAGPDDLVVTFSYDREYLLYYLRRAGCRATVASFPSWLDDQIGWIDTAADLSTAEDGRLDTDADAWVARIRTCLSDGGRVWWVVDSTGRADVDGHLVRALRDAGYTAGTVDPAWRISQIVPAP